MKATELIGKKAIRTSHTTYAHGTISRSCMDEPILILNATDAHIVYEYPAESSMARMCKDINARPHVLSYEYCDDNWTDYDKLVNPQPTQPIAPQEGKGKFKVGQRVIATDNTGHFAKQIATILDIDKSDPRTPFKVMFDKGGLIMWCRSGDIEPYAEPEQPSLTVTREMLVKLGACSSGLAEFDKKFPSGKGEFEEVRKATDVSNSCWLHNHRFSISTMQNEQPKEAVKLYCTNDYFNWNKVKWLTEGKLYTFENGSTTFDDGYETIKYGSFEEFARYNKNMAACLIRAEKRPALIGEWVLITSDGVWKEKRYKTGEVYKIDHINSQNTDRCYFNFCKSDELFFKSSEYLVLDNYHPEPEKEPEPVYCPCCGKIKE